MSAATTPPVVMPYAPAVGHCPLCGRSMLSKKPKMLNGVDVCVKCVNGFANRRQVAYIIDNTLYYFISFVVFGIIGFAIVKFSPVARASFVNTGAFPPGVDVGLTAASVVFWFGFLFKDGFRGRSLGKLICGVRTIDATTREPIGFGRSFKRNLPLFIPFGPLIMAFQLMKGTRWGDQWANTLVVWNKHEHCLPFDKRGVLCTKCGYDLKGNESGRCPECGTGIPTRVASPVHVPFDMAVGPQA